MFVLSLIIHHLFIYHLIGLLVLVGVLAIEIHRDVGVCYGVANPILLILIPFWPILILEQLVILGCITVNKIINKFFRKNIICKYNNTISLGDSNSMYPSIIDQKI